MPEKTEIKICGLYRPEDIEAVNAERPDYAGFIFYPPSHRNVSVEQQAALKAKLSPTIPAVGVFVNAERDLIVRLVQAGQIDIIQLHGKETNEEIEALREELPGTPIWKAFKVRSEEDLTAAEASAADRVLLDNGYGTGESFDWELLNCFKRPFMLAGGLTIENVAEGILKYHPIAVDISSGVETEKKKDALKIKTIIERVRCISRGE